jgi:hypothetical protein
LELPRKKKAAVLARKFIRIVNAKTRAKSNSVPTPSSSSLSSSTKKKKKKKNSESREALLHINYIIIHFLVVFKR